MTGMRTWWLLLVGLVVLPGLSQAATADDWLVSREGLVYGYALGIGVPKQERVIAFDETGEATEAGKDASFVANRGRGLVPRGLARYDRYFGLATVRGSFVATGGVNRIVSACKESSAVSVEVLLTPPKQTPREKSTILWLGPTTGDPNLAFVQEGTKVAMHLRTAMDHQARASVTPLFEWTDGKPRHLAVTYAGSILTIYIDGEQTQRVDTVKGDLSRWRASELVFGDDYQATGSWSGKLEALAIFNRALPASEVKQQHERIGKLLASRKEPRRIHISATLTARSKIPDPASIEPYYQALSVFQYTVDKVPEGKYDGKVIAVAHWVIMDKKKLPIENRPIGEKVDLVLEPYSENPQLETDYWLMSDLEDQELELWYDVTEIP